MSTRRRTYNIGGLDMEFIGRIHDKLNVGQSRDYSKTFNIGYQGDVYLIFSWVYHSNKVYKVAPLGSILLPRNFTDRLSVYYSSGNTNIHVLSVTREGNESLVVSRSSVVTPYPSGDYDILIFSTDDSDIIEPTD